MSGAGSNTVTLNNSGNGASIVADAGSHEIDAPVVLADNLTLSGSGNLTFGAASSISDNSAGYSLTLDAPGGTLILGGSDSYGGGTTVEAGTLVVDSSTGLPAGSSLTVGASAVLQDAMPVAAPVPEPGSLALLLATLWSAAIYCRFWRKAGSSKIGLQPVLATVALTPGPSPATIASNGARRGETAASQAATRVRFPGHHVLTVGEGSVGRW